MKLDDKIIREALKIRLNQYKDCYVFEEFTVPSGKARADLVAVNGHFTGYEIKSDFDSFQRLASQVVEYDKVFEKNYIVVGEKYSKTIKNHIPDYWGIIKVTGEKPDSISIKFLRKAKLNPRFSFYEFAYLLPSNDLKYIAKEMPILSKTYKKTEIQTMMKQEIILLINEKANNSQKLNIKKIIRMVYKNHLIKNLYKKGALLV